MPSIVALSTAPLRPTSSGHGEVLWTFSTSGNIRRRSKCHVVISFRQGKENCECRGICSRSCYSSCSGSSNRTILCSTLSFSRSQMLGRNDCRAKDAKRLFVASASAAELKQHQQPGRPGVQASLMVDPGVWIVRTAVFYVLLETGIAGRGRSLRSPDFADDTSDEKSPLNWLQKVLGGDPEKKRNEELAKVRRQWHASTKGTLVRRYRVPSKAGGRKLLVAISSLLADDDTFRDVATSKGCQIRRENAHAESVCCHNVRALFDEIPTPHLVVEIIVFPAGPITTAHYEKAERLEKVLRTGASI